MYKIMIADDEGIVIDSLKYIINKEFGPNCQTESAKTGRSVIELAESYRPDIAIMDIQMPGINGIEAIRQIKERNPHIIFIIMTAYDKFTYAKEAVTLGVFEYLNKPIEKNTIASVLRQAMKKIDDEREQRSRELMIREKMETVIPIIENGLIYDILMQENFDEDFENYKSILEIRENYGYMAVLICGETQQGLHMTNAVGSSVRIQRMYMSIRENIKDYLKCFVGSTMGNKIVLFLPYDNKEMKYEDRIDVIDKARELIRSLKRDYDAQFRLGIGSVRAHAELGQSYDEAIEALLYSDGSVAHADDMPLRVSYEDNYPIETEKALFAAIDEKNVDLAVTNAGHFFDWMIANYPEDMDNIKLKVIEFVLWAEHLVYEQGGSVYRFQSRKSYLSDILNLNSPEKIRKWFLERIDAACQIAKNQKADNSDSIIGRALVYINENFAAKDMSLDDVSREVDISPYYFSKLFKEETGQNFIDYLTSIRIAKAKELLKDPNISMKEVCLSVGYADPNYFSRNFKKNVGYTPTEYREGLN